MKQKYERIIFTVTHFDEEDVITTSTWDKDNAFQNRSELDNQGTRNAPLTSW